MLYNFDRDRLKLAYAAAKPFPFVKIDNFLDQDFVKRVAEAYPPFDVALSEGVTFKAVNEKKKVQISDSTKFVQAVARLNNLLASPEFLDDLSYIAGIPNLLADADLVGGGMHITGPGGRLDVHVDFNYIEERQLHRRLNLLIYLNPNWDESWGGDIQLWDKEVKHCEASFAPVLNRCVIFETNEISYHGVTPISSTAPMPRKSFATYYYTREAPAHWTGSSHSTIFRARPEERFKKFVTMPMERSRRYFTSGLNSAKRALKSVLPK